MQVRAKSDGNIYAMKILKKRAIIARNQVEHTRAERKILQSLQHPFLMTLRYAFQSKEKLYFVLDYYQGGELFFHLKNNRRFTEEVARIYVGEIALALGHLHSLQIIYRVSFGKTNNKHTRSCVVGRCSMAVALGQRLHIVAASRPLLQRTVQLHLLLFPTLLLRPSPSKTRCGDCRRWEISGDQPSSFRESRE